MAMGMMCWCCLSQEARENKRISDEIDRILLEEEKNLRKEFKLLLLGNYKLKIKLNMTIYSYSFI